jgi:hypothetical protein
MRADGRGVRLEGDAIFIDNGERCRLQYAVVTDAALRTRRAWVVGRAGMRALRIDIRVSDDGAWSLDGREQPEVRGCVDVDLAFTPATNVLPLRRLRLARGQGAAAPAAYLQLDAARLSLLSQRYERVSRSRYRYDAPAFGYSAVLRVARSGIVLLYPGLFEASCYSPSQ